jgi:hypothetical protein
LVSVARARRVVVMGAVLAAAGTPATAGAKDLRGRFGAGFHAGLGSVPAISVRYALPTGDPKVSIVVEADGGASIGGATTDVLAGGRVLYGLVAEDNMNLYAGVGGFFVVQGGGPAARIQPALGAHFFLFGLENLGLSAEWGVNVDFGVPAALATVGGAPAVAVHYYF